MRQTGEAWRLGRRPSLDGLRGIAALLVLSAHLNVPGLHEAGAAGVTMFFALSGFLITTLLLDRQNERGAMSLRGFYLHRAARLGPALLLCVVLAIVVEVAVIGSVRNWSLVVGTLTWSSNFVMADAGWGRWAQTPLTQTWSLSVEEQFYTVWPLLMLALVRMPRKFALLATSGLVLGSFFVAGHVSFEHRYLMLDTRAAHLLVGALLAMALLDSRTRPLSAWWSLPPAVALLALVLVENSRSSVADLVSLLTVGLLYVCAQTRVNWLESRPLLWVGERSYGVYLYHVPIQLLVVQRITTAWWVSALIIAALTSALAWASHRWVESPVRAWGRAVTARIDASARMPTAHHVVPDPDGA